MCSICEIFHECTKKEIVAVQIGRDALQVDIYDHELRASKMSVMIPKKITRLYHFLPDSRVSVDENGILIMQGLGPNHQYLVNDEELKLLRLTLPNIKKSKELSVKMKWQSETQCPLITMEIAPPSRQCYAFIHHIYGTKDIELLVSGVVREWNHVERNFPWVLRKMIQIFFFLEELHVLGINTGKHWCDNKFESL